MRSALVYDDPARVRQRHSVGEVQRARTRQLAGWQRQLRQRIRSLTRLTQYRRAGGLHPGEEAGWIFVLANLVGVMERRVSSAAMLDMAATIGLPALELASVAAIAGDITAARGRKILPAHQCGALVSLTAAERVDCNILDIDAVDEDATSRRRRLAKERQARLRAARAASAAPTMESVEPWLELRISRRTWFRRKAANPGTADVTRPSEYNLDLEDTAHAHALAAGSASFEERDIGSAIPARDGMPTPLLVGSSAPPAPLAGGTQRTLSAFSAKTFSMSAVQIGEKS